ncbi:MAG TPA: type II toxin-antitoxin system PemK/MazF family toxin [Candidatus Baltobacteraceae bacterium]|nr:type II toxin-antitoxin system PemK/MazF family toxin [Candidatus Baltobacteraceae bacterium]
MTAGSIVTVDWRDAFPGSGEPNKLRPGIVVSSPRFFGSGLPFEIIVPLTGEAELAITGASVLITPTPKNGCTKPCYALAWNVQAVPHVRLTETPSSITIAELARIRELIAACIDFA